MNVGVYLCVMCVFFWGGGDVVFYSLTFNGLKRVSSGLHFNMVQYLLAASLVTP